MGHLFNNRLVVKRKNKILYFSPKVWRSMFLIYKSSVYLTAEKTIWNRSSTIPVTFSGQSTIIYNGKSFNKKRINRWLVGYKFGEFTWNRKYALYKAKAKKKNKGKKK